jgi:hypothetical protein
MRYAAPTTALARIMVDLPIALNEFGSAKQRPSIGAVASATFTAVGRTVAIARDDCSMRTRFLTLE